MSKGGKDVNDDVINEMPPGAELVDLLPIDLEGNQQAIQFGDEGMTAALNQWGELVQLSKVEVSKGSKACKIDLEPRSVVLEDFLYHERLKRFKEDPAKQKDDGETDGNDTEVEVASKAAKKENQIARIHSEKLRDDAKETEDGDDEDPSASDSDDNEPKLAEAREFSDFWDNRRHKSIQPFFRSSGRAAALGLRLTSGYSIRRLQAFFKHDRWPEVRYSIDDRVDVHVQHFIKDGVLVQQMKLKGTEKCSDPFKVDVELCMASAFRHSTFGLLPNHVSKHRVDKCKKCTQTSLVGGKHQLTVALFKNREALPLDELGSKVLDMSEEYNLCRKQAVEVVYGTDSTITATFSLSSRKGHDCDLKAIDIDEELEADTGRWWKWDSPSESFLYRRNLEHILNVCALPVPSKKAGEVHRYFLGDGDLVVFSFDFNIRYWHIEFLLSIAKILEAKQTKLCDKRTLDYYQSKIHAVVKGNMLWMHDLNLSPWDLWAVYHNDVAVVLDINGLNACTDLPSVLESYTSQDRDSFLETQKDAGFEKSELYTAFPRSQCFLILSLARYLDTYTEDRELADELIAARLNTSWKILESARDPASRLWPLRFSEDGDNWQVSNAWEFSDYSYEYSELFENLQRLKLFRLFDQILVWKTMYAIKALAEVSPEDGGVADLAGRLDPESLKERVKECLLVEEKIKSKEPRWKKHETVRTSYATARFAHRLRHDIDPNMDNSFFKEQGGFMEPWINTLKTAPWNPTLSSKSQFRTAFDRFHEARDLLLLAQLAPLYSPKMLRDDAFTEELTARLKDCAFNTGIFPAEFTYSDQTARNFDFSIVTTILRMSFPEELDYVGITHEAVQSGKYYKETDGDASNPAPPQNPDDAKSRQWIQAALKTKIQRKAHLSDQLNDPQAVNDPPSYGPSWCYMDPSFLSFQPPSTALPDLLLELWETENFKKVRDWYGQYSEHTCKFALQERREKSESELLWVQNLGLVSEVDQVSTFNFPRTCTVPDTIPLSLFKKRDKRESKKRIIGMPCLTKPLAVSLMMLLEGHEAVRLSIFIDRMTRNKPVSIYETFLPDNLWLTEFSITFIQLVGPTSLDDPDQKGYFPSRQSPFLDRVPSQYRSPKNFLKESSLGFRWIGDLHDRYWTVYQIANVGAAQMPLWTSAEVAYSEELKKIGITQKIWALYAKNRHQRKVAEAGLINLMLRILHYHTSSICECVYGVIGPLESSLFVEGQSQINTSESLYQNMYKNKILYPWALELLQMLSDFCDRGLSQSESWQKTEASRVFKPRWSIRDELKYGRAVRVMRKQVAETQEKLERQKQDIQDYIARFERLKTNLADQLALGEARRSVVLGENVQLFTILSLIFLPLSFSTSILSVQDFSWPNPVANMFTVAAIVVAVTIVIVLNLGSLTQGILTALEALESFFRRRMFGDRLDDPAEPTDGDRYTAGTALKNYINPAADTSSARPSFWYSKARKLEEMRHRKRFIGGDSNDYLEESHLWIWIFAVFHAGVQIPVRETTFALHVLSGRKTPGIGPLQVVIRLLANVLWLPLLLLLYLAILLYSALACIFRIIFSFGLPSYLWYGPKSERPDYAMAAAGHHHHHNTVQKVPWWRRPFYVLGFRPMILEPEEPEESQRPSTRGSRPRSRSAGRSPGSPQSEKAGRRERFGDAFTLRPKSPSAPPWLG